MMLSRRSTLLLLAGMVSACHAFAVVGYVPEYRAEGLDWLLACSRATHLILFSVEFARDGSLSALDRLPRAATLASARTASSMFGSKLLLGIGGAGRSGAFAEVALSAKKRAAAAKNVASLIEREGLHGVDLNWESPRSREEWSGLLALLKALHDELSPSGKLVTMALHPGQEALLRGSGAERNVDLIHMMAYDNMCAFPKKNPPCEHSTLEFAGDVVTRVKASGVPASKFTLGVPFYARHVMTGEAKTYGDVARDAASLDPSADLSDEFYFNGVGTVRAKTRLAKESGLGGVMIWELGQDADQKSPACLLKAIAEEARAPPKKEL